MNQPTVLLAVLALVVACSGVVLTWTRPRTGLVGWLLVVAFVPVWVEARVLVPVSAASAVGLVVLVGLVGLLGRQALVLGPADLLMAFLFLAASSPFLVGQLSLSALVGVTVVGGGGFGLGRLAGHQLGLAWVSGAVAVVFTAVAGLAVLEFATGWHGLASWGPSNSTGATWRPIQVRGGLARSEGAFGHSIALGSSLALAAVLATGSRFRPVVKLAMIAVMLAGVATTLSRAAVIAAVLGLLLVVVFSRDAATRASRRGLGLLLVVAAGLFVPYFLRVLAESDEAEGSAAYRGGLLSLLSFVKFFGRSDALQISPGGRAYFGGFRSIDSQLVLFGLSYGALTLGLVLVLLLLAATRVLVLRAHAPTIAIVAQLPCLMTVALITQYHVLFWFVVGLAAAAEAGSPRDVAPAPRSSPDLLTPSESRAS